LGSKEHFDKFDLTVRSLASLKLDSSEEKTDPTTTTLDVVVEYSPIGTPSRERRNTLGKKDKRDAKRRDEELKKEVKQKEKEEKLKKEKEEKLKARQEERDARKEKELKDKENREKKRIEKKLRKKLNTPYGDAISHSMKDLSSLILADYVSEKRVFSQVEEFLTDFSSKLIKYTQRVQAMYEERATLIKDIQEQMACFKDKYPLLSKCDHKSKLLVSCILEF
jgi:flagellar biosynthesis GTPase FlhF